MPCFRRMKGLNNVKLTIFFLVASTVVSSLFAFAPAGSVSFSPSSRIKRGDKIVVQYHTSGFQGGKGDQVLLTCGVIDPDGQARSKNKSVPITDDLEAELDLAYGQGGDFGSTTSLGTYTTTCSIYGSGWALSRARFTVEN